MQPCSAQPPSALEYYNQAGTNIVNINEGGTLSVASGNRLSMDREVNSVGGTIASQSPSSGDGSGQTYTFRDSNGGLYNFTSAADGTPSTIAQQTLASTATSRSTSRPAAARSI